MIFKVARAELHNWEEPVISGEKGSGTVFFCGCSMRCVFCQNYNISRSTQNGLSLTDKELLNVFCSLEQEGALNINLVTPSHYAKPLRNVLLKFKKISNLPIVYNTNAYESVENLKLLDGLVDIYLPDLKYVSSELSFSFSGRKDYFEKAYPAILEMQRQQPENIIEDGIMKKGVIVRHLVLPNCTDDSKEVLDALCRMPQKPLVSIMSQYFPTESVQNHPTLNRKISIREYEKVTDYANVLGFDGFTQDLKSATMDYTPSFDLSILEKRLNGIKIKKTENEMHPKS